MCARPAESPRAPAVYFSDFAEMCRQKGLLAEGEEAGRRAVALAPNFAAAWNNLGIVLQETLKLDESRLCLERALALEPNNAETLNNLANTFKRLGLAAEAEKRWTRGARAQARLRRGLQQPLEPLQRSGRVRPRRDHGATRDRAQSAPRRRLRQSRRRRRPRAIATPTPCACSTRSSPSRRGMRARSRRGR